MGTAHRPPQRLRATVDFLQASLGAEDTTFLLYTLDLLSYPTAVGIELPRPNCDCKRERSGVEDLG